MHERRYCDTVTTIQCIVVKNNIFYRVALICRASSISVLENDGSRSRDSLLSIRRSSSDVGNVLG